MRVKARVRTTVDVPVRSRAGMVTVPAGATGYIASLWDEPTPTRGFIARLALDKYPVGLPAYCAGEFELTDEN